MDQIATKYQINLLYVLRLVGTKLRGNISSPLRCFLPQCRDNCNMIGIKVAKNTVVGVAEKSFSAGTPVAPSLNEARK